MTLIFMLWLQYFENLEDTESIRKLETQGLALIESIILMNKFRLMNSSLLEVFTSKLKEYYLNFGQ